MAAVLVFNPQYLVLFQTSTSAVNRRHVLMVEFVVTVLVVTAVLVLVLGILALRVLQVSYIHAL